VTVTPNSRASAVRVHLGGDHAAYELKEQLITWLRLQEYEVVDHGPHVHDPQDNYLSGDPRHQRRIDMLTEYEATGSLPARPAAPIAQRAQHAAPNT
jgi:hypothetical protein